MDFHVLTPAGPELLMYVVDGELVIVPAPGAQESVAGKEKPSQ